MSRDSDVVARKIHFLNSVAAEEEEVEAEDIRDRKTGNSIGNVGVRMNILTARFSLSSNLLPCPMWTMGGRWLSGIGAISVGYLLLYHLIQPHPGGVVVPNPWQCILISSRIPNDLSAWQRTTYSAVIIQLYTIISQVMHILGEGWRGQRFAVELLLNHHQWHRCLASGLQTGIGILDVSHLIHYTFELPNKQTFYILRIKLLPAIEQE